MMSRATLWADAERETGTNWSPTPEVICGVANGNPVLSNGTSRKNMFGMQQCNLFSAPRNNICLINIISSFGETVYPGLEEISPPLVIAVNLPYFLPHGSHSLLPVDLG